MAEFLHDLNIHGAGQIQFKTTAGANAGKIDQNGNDLVLSNAVGDIIIGNGSDDVYIGDGTNAVDIRFEQNMAIYADSSSTRTLTLGGANTSLILESPTINGSLNIGATTINNKLTFTTASGYILFDYETSDTGEYGTEAALLKIDRGGTEKTILSRVSKEGGIALGADDTVAILAGDVKNVIKTNLNLANENVIIASETGFHAFGFPNNDTTWSNRQEFRFYTGGTDTSLNGLWIGDGGNSQFIDLDRNLKNIGTISSGAITATDYRSSSHIYLTSGDSWIFRSTGGTEYARVKSNGYLGIGTTNPDEKLHVMYQHADGAPTTYAKAVIEDVDAQLDLLSTSAGTWGSSINLVEAAGSGANTDVWGIARKTTGGSGDSSLNFNFGTSNEHSNTTRVSFSSTGNITANQLNLDSIGDYITFYGGGETNHSITSRQLDGGTGDDIRVNTYGSFIVNLDSNDNQTSAANSSFFVGRHGSNASAISGTNLLFQIDGQTGNVLPGADSTHDLGTSSNRWANVYADTLYGDGSNITNVPGPSNMVTTDTSQTISGSKNFTNVGNQFNGHVYFNAYDANGNHYPHFRDGSNNNGANVNIRQYYGSSNYKTHVMSSDSSGNMQFDFQGTLKGDALTIDGGVDINGSADISGTLTSGKHVINTGSDDILTLNQTSTDNKWNYINFNNQGARDWFIGQDSDGNFDLYNDNINAYAITVNLSNNSILLNDTVTVAQALTVTSGDVTLSAGNIIVGSQYGIRFNDANTRIYTNTDTPEDLLVEADQDILLTPDGQVNVHSNLVLSDNSYVVSARKFTARDGNGVMLTADDASSGLSIADNGNATFTGHVSATEFRPTNIVTNKVVKFNGTQLDDANITDTGSLITLGSNTTVSGTLTVTGNLDITGDINTQTVNNLDVVDKLITLGKGQSEANSNGSGIFVDGSSASLLWDESNNTWDFNKSLDVVGNIQASGNITATGSGNTALSVISTGGYSQLITQASDSDSAYIFFKDTSGERARLYSSTSNDLIFKTNGGSTTALTLNNSGNATFAGNLSTGSITAGSDTNEKDFKVYGNDTGELLQWLGAHSKLRINHDTDDAGLEIFTVASAQPTSHQVKIGRDSGQYLGIRVDDGRSYFIHRQDESGGTDNHHQTNQIWTDGGGTHTWNWDIANSSGGSPSNKMQLNSSGALSLAGNLTASNFSGSSSGTNTGDQDLSGLAAASHTHAASDITSGTLAVARGGTGLTSQTTYLNVNSFANFASSSADWDTITTRGSYRLTGSTNNPFGSAHATGIVITQGSGDYGIQLFSSASTDNGTGIAYRYRGTSWQNWQYLVTKTYADGRYLLDSEVTNLSQVKAFDSSDYATAAQGTKADNALPKAGGTMTGHLRINDGLNLYLGNQTDLVLSHNGTNSFISNYVGDLIVENAADGKDLIFKCDNGSGGVTSYFELDGSAVVTKFRKHLYLLDNVGLKIGNSYDLDIKHDGTDSYISNSTGNLYITNGGDDKDIIFKSDDGSGGTTTYFFLDGSSTTTQFYKTIKLYDDAQIYIGDGNDLRLYHNGTSNIDNYTGNLDIIQRHNDGDIRFYNDDGSGGTTEYFRIDGGATKTIISKAFQFFDNVKAEFGDSSDLQIYHGQNHSYIDASSGTGSLYIRPGTGNTVQIEDKDGNDMITASPTEVRLLHNNSEKLATTSTGIIINNSNSITTDSGRLQVNGAFKATGNIVDVDIPYVIHTGWGDDTSTTANKIIPLGNSVTEQNVSAADGQHFFVAPYAGSVKKIIMKNVAGTLSSGFTTELKLYINGSQSALSGELTASSNAITWEPSSSNTFSAADTISLVYQKSASSKYWREVALTMVLIMDSQDI